MIGHHHPGGHTPDPSWHEMRSVVHSRLADPRVQAALSKDHKVSQDYQVAYIAGISKTLTTLYADSEFPLTSFPVKGKTYDVTDELWLHECGEACFILLFGDHYLRAHRLITVAEHDMAVSRGINWPAYVESFEIYARADEHETIRQSPPDLFMRPYQDSGDWQLIQRIRETGGPND
jgi:hypothetical protein